jgi:DnaD/phage-associated family protein
MATYRQVQTSFWQDGFVLDLTPEEKYFFLYLMTNSKTSQCGIYELPKRIIETETGYNRETVDKLLKRFEEYGKILYCDKTKEIMIVNWIKHNKINSPKVKACIRKELMQVKNKEFVALFLSQCEQYGYGIDTVSIDLGEEKEEEKEQEEEKEKEDDEEEEEAGSDSETGTRQSGISTDSRVDPVTFYQQNIGVIPPIVLQDIQQWIDKNHFDEPEEIIVEALKETIMHGARSWKYTTKILISWADRGLRTLEQVRAAMVEHERNKTHGYQGGAKGRAGRVRQENKVAADQAYLDKLRGEQVDEADHNYDPTQDKELQQLMSQLQSRGDSEP